MLNTDGQECHADVKVCGIRRIVRTSQINASVVATAEQKRDEREARVGADGCGSERVGPSYDNNRDLRCGRTTDRRADGGANAMSDRSGGARRDYLALQRRRPCRPREQPLAEWRLIATASYGRNSIGGKIRRSWPVDELHPWLIAPSVCLAIVCRLSGMLHWFERNLRYFHKLRLRWRRC